MKKAVADNRNSHFSDKYERKAGCKMLSILVNWIYMGSIVLLAGFALMQGYFALMKKVNGHACKDNLGFTHVMFAGILGTTLYAQIFSLFYRVNIEANFLLLILVVIYFVSQKKYIRYHLGVWKQSYHFWQRKKWILYIVIILAGILFAFSSAGEAKLIDTEWYHAQTIRWIEEYGCVKGVANLFYSLGFNNAQHYFDALFGMDWLFGQSMRGSGGFFGLLIFIHGMLRISRWKEHDMHVADALAIGEVAYSIIVTAFYTDPYVDTSPNILVLFILTEWIALLEKKSEEICWYGYYCLLTVFAVVAKTSVAMIVLLAIYPIVLMIKQKKAAQIPLYIGIGFGIALPYLITNFITTGYPIYLLSSLGIFDVKWKVDPEVLKHSVDSMVAFARMPLGTIEEALGSGLSWVLGWFLAESLSHQILYVVIAFLLLYDLIHILRQALTGKMTDGWMVFPRICVYIGLVYWFFTIPQVKYCWSFLIFPVAVIPAVYWQKTEKKHWLLQKGIVFAAIMLLVMYTGFYSLRTLQYVKDGITNYPVMQADYKTFNMGTVEKDGHVFYVRKDGGDLTCGYHMFPYLDNKDDLENLVLGEDLGEGFYFETKDKEDEK